MSMTSNLPEFYKQVLLRDRQAAQFTDGRPNPRSRLAEYPLPPFLTEPQLPSADEGLGTMMELPGSRGAEPSVYNGGLS
jgi:hypothetical protein